MNTTPIILILVGIVFVSFSISRYQKSIHLYVIDSPDWNPSLLKTCFFFMGAGLATFVLGLSSLIWNLYDLF